VATLHPLLFQVLLQTLHTLSRSQKCFFVVLVLCL
jgi:hypothetical protein